MTVEQRIITQGEEKIKSSLIKPGESLVKRTVLVEREHPRFPETTHSEANVVFTASCSPDNEYGHLSFKDPQGVDISFKFTDKVIPSYIIRHPNGRLGLIEWEHLQDRD